jgi:translation elongation factor EF-Tu-like GTPase
MTAQFKARDTFIIKGRGLVLTGWVIEGVLKVGMTLSLPAFPRRLAIDGFEMIHTTDPAVPKLGLLFLGTDQAEIQLWTSLDVKEKIFEVTSLEPQS